MRDCPASSLHRSWSGQSEACPPRTLRARSPRSRESRFARPTHCSDIYTLFHENTQRVRHIIPKWFAFDKTTALIERERLRIMNAGLEPQHTQPTFPGDFL